MKKTINYRKGFTLIELLVAISIIGILSALLMTNLQGARLRARDVQRKSDLNQVKTALRMYYNDNQNYPADDDSGNISGVAWGSQFGTTTVYMKELPQDPLGSSWVDYYYTQTNSGEGFSLYTCLENKSDSSGSAVCGSLTCSTVWCYKVEED